MRRRAWPAKCRHAAAVVPLAPNRRQRLLDRHGQLQGLGTFWLSTRHICLDLGEGPWRDLRVASLRPSPAISSRRERLNTPVPISTVHPTDVELLADHGQGRDFVLRHNPFERLPDRADQQKDARKTGVYEMRPE